MVLPKNILPNEIIAHILHFLDVKSLLRVSYVATFFHVLVEEHFKEHLKWVRLCFTDTWCQSLIKAAVIKEELLNGTLDAQLFYNSVNTKNIEQIKSLLFLDKSRYFHLYVASYEQKTPVFFACSGNDTRTLYLTEDAAKNKTLNVARVKQWLRVRVPVDAALFYELYTTQKVPHKELIPQTAILPTLESRTASLLNI
ncbi:F-box protein [Legionella drancourtii]|uniref:F-box domain-containing protein n=1 Tax=Legionella drancourtii LLAP12 TaxID=658187 RepID=G9ES58_9GAMM|nr:F-box protein [Legionella drancourtii]EHL29839.1 hypothetical protein LDG_8131 [Legionella drancourtii LLAP12]